ncbi:ribosome biogenesis protein YTM1 [Amanita rubescens]|nr:ribosome biogenesis protein YTM1 [Amanita rubescens]
MASSTSGTAPAQSQPVSFTTRTAYPLPTQKFLIPTTWKRYQLSQLVNKALSLSRVVPLDFLVRGEILRTSLGEWCAEHGVGEEETLEIEYIESVLPPQKLSDFPHDDWVSSVSCQTHGHFLTGSYDGVVRAFNYSRTLVASARFHNAPITSITTIPNSSGASSSDVIEHIVATASHDLTALLSRLEFNSQPQLDMSDEQDTTKSTNATPLAALHLHTAPLSSITSNKQGTHLLTASWDSVIGVWDTHVPTEHEVADVRSPAAGVRTKKRRRIEDEGGEDGMEGVVKNGIAVVDMKNIKRKAPITVMKSHTARVSRAQFGTENRGVEGKAYSCGFDSTVRLWDVETGLCEHTITASEKPFVSLALPGANLVLSIATDRTMTLFDLRVPTSAVPTTTPTSFIHPAMPSCIALPTYPGSTTTSDATNQVVTGAYDGIVRIWDLRSTKSAIATFDAFESDGNKDSKKILDVDWNAERGVVGVGGEAGFVVWNFKEDVRSQ